MTNGNEQDYYDKLLQAGDNVGKLLSENKENTELTDEDIESIINTIETIPESPETKTYREIKDTDHGKLEGYSQVEMPVINPNNGIVISNNDPSVSIAYNDIDLDEIMTLDGPVADTKIEIDEKSVEETIVSIYPGIKLTSQNITSLVALANRYNNGEKLNYYNEMPESIKDSINIILGSMATTMGPYSNEGRNYIAKQLLNTIVESSYTKTVVNDMNVAVFNTMTKFNEISNSAMSDLFKFQKQQFEINYPNQADAYETAILNGEIKNDDIDKVQRSIDMYRGVSNAYIQSYKYDNMMEKYKAGKLKVKDIQLKKLKRECDSFNYKYMKHKNSINDIRLTVSVLDRHLADNIDLESIKKFICIFINYTKNMSPDNIKDHIFMYYFIKHIISLDSYNSSNADEEKFYSELKCRLNTIISSL